MVENPLASLRSLATTALGVGTLFVMGGPTAHAQQAPQAKASTQPEQELPVPTDPDLQQQMDEVQGALRQITNQITQQEQARAETKDPDAQAQLEGNLESLREDRDELDALLEQLAEQAKRSEKTPIDAALERTRWYELQRQYEERKQEAIRDRQ